MTKREIIYTLFEKLRITVDDDKYTEEFMSSLIDSTRAKLIKQSFVNIPWAIPNEIKQELCMELEAVNTIDGLTCFGTILRTTEALPRGIYFKGATGSLLRVKRYDRTAMTINIVPVERLPYVGHDTFVSQMVYAAKDIDGKVYFVSDQKKHKLLKYVKIDGVYEQPDIASLLACLEPELTTKSSPGGEATKTAYEIPTAETFAETWDNEYPISLSMVDDLIEIIFKQLAPSLNIPEDELNDADNDRG